MKRLPLSLAATLLASFVLSCGPAEKARPPVVPEQVGGVAAASELDQPTPIDPRVRKGTLPNGLTYYVYAHRHPEKRAQLWLGVNAGSVLEDDDQQGLAHFVEHMAFNGTENFEKMSIVNYIESVGMQFGADVNAYTSFDETVYMLQVPTDDAAIVDTGMKILRDWSGRVSFDPVEVDKERGVVTEEWRLGRGAGMRIVDKQYPVLFHGSRYATRLPIGKKEILANAPREALTRFYRDWYRPDLMAVVAVGDFDVAAMEAKIKATFSDLKGPASPRPRAPVPLPTHDQTLVSIETDAEMPQTTVRITNKIPHRPETTLGDYRTFVGDQLFNSMFGARMAEIGEDPDAPFMFAYSSISGLSRTTDAFEQFAVAKEGHIEDTLVALLEEVERIKRHGFTASELERARKDVLRNAKRSHEGVDTQEGRDIAAEMLRNFFEDEMIPGRALEYEYVKRFAPSISLEELNGYARAWSGTANRVILVSAPAKGTMPTEAALLALAAETAKKDIAPYVDEVSDKPLMAAAPTKGRIVSTKTIGEIGVTEWTLSNGARVVLKPTDFQTDEVQFAAFSPGGTSLASDANFDHADAAADVVSAAGVSDLDPTQLAKRLAGKVVAVRPYIGELHEGLWGHSSTDDLETMMQLAHLRFTAPRKDPTSFQVWKQQQLEWVRNRRLSPESAFFEDAGLAFSLSHPRRQPWTPERVERVQLDKAFAFYQDRFADASDFTFTFVGSFDPARLEPLVETYLASLPGLKRKETWKDVKVRFPKGVKQVTMRGGSEPKSFVYLVFHGDQRWSPEAENDLEMMQEALRIRMREVLREDMGGVYGVQSYGGIERRPTERRTYMVFFGCDPANVDKLKKAVFDEIAAIRKNGVDAAIIEKIKNQRVRQRELEIEENGFWARRLGEAYDYGEDPRKILVFQKWVDAVSSDRIKAAAARYASDKQFFSAVLVPANTSSK